QSARVLDSAAAELLDLQQSRVDFSALVTVLTDSMAGPALALEVRIEADIERGVFVFAQADAVETIVENLIDNAISFSPSGGVVRVGLKRTDRGVELMVADEGPGVDPSRL